MLYLLAIAGLLTAANGLFQGPLINVPVIPLSGPQARELELTQNPELLALAPESLSRVHIEITGDRQAVVLVEGVNANIDCNPWLRQFPEGTTDWLRQRRDLNGQFTEPFPTLVSSSVRISIGGTSNRWLNITSTIIAEGAEVPSQGDYICRSCDARGTEFETCRNATLTVHLLGAAPVLRKGPDEIVRGGPFVTVDIGTDICFDPNDPSSLSFTIACEIAPVNLAVGIRNALPDPTRTWSMEDPEGAVQIYNASGNQQPVFNDKFFERGNRILFMPGVIPQSVTQPAIFSLPRYGGLSISLLVTENATEASIFPEEQRQISFVQQLVIEEILGTYTCMVGNVFGSDMASTTISLCDQPMENLINLPVIPLSGPQAQDIELTQNPELLALAPESLSRVHIQITGARQAVVLVEGVNANIDCNPWLRQFPEGTTDWLRQRRDLNGELIDRFPAQILLSSRISIGGTSNRWLNISSTIIAEGAEVPDQGDYICRSCDARGTEFETCRNATLTVHLLGAPPVLNKGPDEIVRGGPFVTVDIGTNICFDPNDFSSLSFTIACEIAPVDLAVGIRNALPDLTRTWSVEDPEGAAQIYNASGNQQPVFNDRFFERGNRILFMPGVIPQSVTQPAIFSLPIFGGLSISLLVTENATEASMLPEEQRQIPFVQQLVIEEILGTYTCMVGNVFGSDFATTTISLCGEPASLPGCPVPNIVMAADNDVVSVGCSVIISRGASVTLDCAASGSTIGLMYRWTDDMGTELSREQTLVVSRAGSYTCIVNNREGRDTLTSIVRSILLRPSYGNQLGGTPVVVQPLRLEPNDFIQCTFDGVAVFGTYLDSSSALCVTPIMNTQGIVNVEVTIITGSSRETFSTTFTSLSPIRAYGVDFSVESTSSDIITDLYFGAGDHVQLTWLPEELLSSDLVATSTGTTVNIHLYQFRDRPRIGKNRSPWVQIHEVSDVPNVGLFEFQIPDDIALENCLGQDEVCPVVFRISAVAGTRVEISGGIEVELQGEAFAGIWSAVAFLQARQATSTSLSNICDQWAQPSNRILGSRLRRLPACPRKLRQAIWDSRFQLETSESLVTRLTTQYDANSRRFYTPMASTCYVQTVMEGSASDVGHQCCYDVEGRLVTGQGGGSIDKVSPLTSFTDHLMEDLLPYAFCCHGGLRCDLYEEFRPSRHPNEPVFVLPVPACVFGDPHLITLDGHRYTFNGKGEFTLVDTHDNIITVQGRMEQAVDSSGNPAPGTVFTSIVAHQAGEVERTVEFQVNQQGGLDILVDQERVDFTDLQEQSFRQVVVINDGNSSGVAEFSEGANIRVEVENGIISVMLITLPERYNSLTSGLMGNFNGDETDDFVPRGSTASMPVDSSAEEIFSFGNTWIITESESFFAYNRPGESITSFRDPDFTPAFEPEFDDPELQQRADELCGGDQACLFDIAATKNEEIGMATMMGIMEFEMIVEDARPIICDPPCDQGVCVATNNCSCAMGYSGPRCTLRIERECDSNLCQNGGTCVQHARSITCTCPEGFIGIFCQEQEPPLSLRLINSSPRISGRRIAVDFIPSQPLSSARCILINQTEVDCLSGRARFSNLTPGSYLLNIEGETAIGERAVETRTVFVCTAESGSCGVSLINEGVTVSGDCARLQFTGCFFCNSYACRLDGGSFAPCRSPLRYCGLQPGLHSFQVVPTDPDCTETERLTRSFTIF